VVSDQQPDLTRLDGQRGQVEYVPDRRLWPSRVPTTVVSRVASAIDIGIVQRVVFFFQWQYDFGKLVVGTPVHD